jgi:hypothetical protein
MWPVYLTILMVGLLSASSASGEDFNGEWEKISESDGIIGYSRPNSETSVNEIKAIGTVDASVAVIEALLRDDPAKTEYSERCVEAFKVEIPGLENTKDTYYTYHRIGMPWPFYDRDGVARVECKIDQTTGAFLMVAYKIQTDFRAEQSFVLRVPILAAKWILTPIGKNKTRVLYQILADPGGNLPAFIVNMILKDLAVMTVVGVREMVKKDKYKNAKSIVTTTPWDRYKRKFR